MNRRRPSGKGTGNRRRVTPAQRRQQHLLDVKVRSRKAVQQRNRLLARVFFTLVLCGGLGAGGYLGARRLLERFLWENNDYRIASVEVLTDGSLTREEILAVAEIREGENIFSVKLSEARERLEGLAQVEQAELQRDLPNRVRVKVLERRPVAWLASSDAKDPSLQPGSYLVDARGIVFRQDGAMHEFLHLPVIYGVDTSLLDPGKATGDPDIQSALELLRMHGEDTRFQIRTIDLSKGYCMVATDRNHARITFGLERIEFQLNRLSKILDYVESNRQELQTVNLMVERNVPVTFMPPPDPASAAEGAAAQETHAKKETAEAHKPEHVEKRTPSPTPRKAPEVRRAQPAQTVRRALPATR